MGKEALKNRLRKLSIGAFKELTIAITIKSHNIVRKLKLTIVTMIWLVNRVIDVPNKSQTHQPSRRFEHLVDQMTEVLTRSSTD